MASGTRSGTTYLHDGKGWRQLDDWDDHVVSLGFGPGRELWLVSRKDAPRGKVMKLAPNAKSVAAAKLVIPEGKDAIVSSFQAGPAIVATADRLFVTYQLGGPTEVRAFTLAGKPAKAPPLPEVASVGRPVVWRGGILIGASTFTSPWSVGLFDPVRGTYTDLPALAPKLPVDLSAFEVSRETATSKASAARCPSGST